MRRVAVTGLGRSRRSGTTRRRRGGPRSPARAASTSSALSTPSELPGADRGRGEGLRPDAVVSPKEARKIDRNVLLALAAAQEAVARRGARTASTRPASASSFGSAIGGLLGIWSRREVLRERGPDRVSPSFIPSVLVDSASGQLAISLGIRGPNYAPVSACATGSHAVGEGPS